MRDDRCPFCGKPPVNSVMVWGHKFIGCPCVGNRTWSIPDRWAPGGWVQLVGDAEADNHDPGDEDRR